MLPFCFKLGEETFVPLVFAFLFFKCRPWGGRPFAFGSTPGVVSRVSAVLVGDFVKGSGPFGFAVSAKGGLSFTCLVDQRSKWDCAFAGVARAINPDIVLIGVLGEFDTA